MVARRYQSKGTLYIGGKMDDVTILVARVVPVQTHQSFSYGADSAADSSGSSPTASPLASEVVGRQLDGIGFNAMDQVFWGSAGETTNLLLWFRSRVVGTDSARTWVTGSVSSAMSWNVDQRSTSVDATTQRPGIGEWTW